MGQYYYVCNVDKKQYLHPHKFGDGLKLMEFGSNSCGTMLGLAILLADGNGNGGGDFSAETALPAFKKLIGSWAGDRIVIAGDYAANGIPLYKGRACTLVSPVTSFAYAEENYKDISYDVIELLCAEDSGGHCLAREILAKGTTREEMIKRDVELARIVDAEIRLGGKKEVEAA